MDKIEKEMESLYSPNYPRFQASFFIGNGGKDNQIVVRNEDWEEFKKDLIRVKEIRETAEKKYKKEVAPAEAFVSPQAPQTPQGTPQVDIGYVCPHHNKKMTKMPAGTSKAGKPYNAFWSCGEKNPDNSWCSYKPELVKPQDKINQVR